MISPPRRGSGLLSRKFAWCTSVSGNIAANTSEQAVVRSVTRPVPMAIASEQSQKKVRVYSGTVQATRSANIAFSVQELQVKHNGRKGRLVKKGGAEREMGPGGVKTVTA